MSCEYCKLEKVFLGAEGEGLISGLFQEDLMSEDLSQIIMKESMEDSRGFKLHISYMVAGVHFYVETSITHCPHCGAKLEIPEKEEEE